MTTAAAERIVFDLDGVPKNPSNQRGHWASKYRDTSSWKEAVRLFALQERARHHWPAPTAEDGKRAVYVTLFRCQLLDSDNAVASIKAVLDGLVGALVFSDSIRYVALTVRQVKVAHRTDQKTRVEISFVGG
jgi:hypothetical protein